MTVCDIEAASAFAVVRTNTLVNGASNWNSASSYTDTSFVPGAGDVVIIPEDATVYLSSADAASFNIMSNLSYLCFTYTNSVMELTVPEGGDALFDCSFKGLWEPTANGQFYSGLIVKKGKGRITAGIGSKYPSGYDYSYHKLPIRIDEGTWRCAQNIPFASAKYITYSTVHVAEGAYFCLPSSVNSSGFLTVSRLTGSGTVTTDGGKFQLRITPPPSPVGKYTTHGEFSGVLDKGVQYFSSGRVFLTGIDSTSTNVPSTFGLYGSYATNTGYTAVMKFGEKNNPSSIGSNATVDADARGGGWGYLDEGETTDKTFRWNPNSDCPSMLFDGGAKGGLVFSGHWRPKTHGVGWLVLTGSNTAPCVVDCAVQLDPTKPGSGWGANDSSNFPVSVTKYGTGTWRFKHSVNRHLLGLFDIQQGTIQADSFDEAGVSCAMGLATNMYVDGYSANSWFPDETKRVTDHAYVLGAEASAAIAGTATEGAFEYTGTNSACCFTRPFVLDGDGRIKNSTDHRFWIGKVSSRSAGAKTLTLDGNGANTNLLADITDAGGGAISLAKEGTGTWIVSGTNDIRGDIAVKAGTLILQNINGQPNTWFKWQIRGKHAESTDSSNAAATIRTDEFGLFNAEGGRVNIGLLYCADYQDLGPGQAAYATYRKRYGSVNTPMLPYSAIERLFDATTGDAGIRICYSSAAEPNGIVPKPEYPDTWQTIMMRLGDGAGEVVSWDYADYYGTKDGETREMYNIKTSALYGSANGANWELLDLAENVPMRSQHAYWAFDGRTANGSTHTNCNTVASRVQGVYPFLGNMAGSVSVASGATLECQGAAVTFSKVRLDAAGAGTIRGAAFAAGGEISVENVETKGVIAFNGLFDGCSGEENVADWTIRVNGSVTSRRRASVRNGTLLIEPMGLIMTIR